MYQYYCEGIEPVLDVTNASINNGSNESISNGSNSVSGLDVIATADGTVVNNGSITPKYKKVQLGTFNCNNLKLTFKLQVQLIVTLILIVFILKNKD